LVLVWRHFSLKAGIGIARRQFRSNYAAAPLSEGFMLRCDEVEKMRKTPSAASRRAEKRAALAKL
jgi:hypothetical protein